MAGQDIGTVYVQVVPSGKDFGKTIEGQIGQSVAAAGNTGGNGLLKSLTGAFSKVGKIGLGAVSAVGGGITALAAKGGFERALNIENAQAKLKGLGHSATDISAIMDNALASVKGTAFGLGDAATVAASLSASGVKSGRQMTDVLKTVADTAQISGRSLTDIGTIFGSVAARGKLQGDDMLQLMSSGVPVLQLLATHLGKTSAEVSDMVSKGKIDFQTFADAMQEGLGGAALAAGDTFQGALANVKAALGRLGEGPGKIALESLRKAFNAAIPAIDALGSQLTPFLDKLNGQLGPYIDKAIGLIERFSAGLQDGSITIQDIAGQIGTLAGAFAVFTGVGGNIDSIIGFFDLLGTAGDRGVTQLTSKVKSLPDGIKSVFSAFMSDGATMAENLAFPFQLAGEKISGSKIGQKIASLGSGISDGVGKITSTLKSKLVSGFASAAFSLEKNPVIIGPRSFGGKLGGIASGVAGKAKAALGPIGDAFGGIAGVVGPRLQSGLNAVGGLITSFFSPGNFIKLLGIGAIIAALVAGLGMLDQSMQGQLFAMIGRLGAQLPGMLQNLSMQIAANLPQMIAQGAAILTALMGTISANAPKLLSTAALLITTLVQGLGQALPSLLPAAVQMITSLIAALIAQAPMLIEGGMQLLQGLVQGITAALPMLGEQIPLLVQTIMTALVAALPQLMQSGVQVVTSLIQGLVAAMPTLAAMIPRVVMTIVDTLLANLPGIVSTGVRLLASLANGLVNAIPQLVGRIPAIIAALVGGIASRLPQIIQSGVQIIITLAGGLVQAIPQLVAKIPAIFSSLVSGFLSQDWGKIGLDIITGIAKGIAGAAGKLVDAAVDAAKNALNWVKNKLGIGSPSKVFRDEVGRWIPAGMAVGIDRNEGTVSKAATNLAKGALAPMLGVPDQYRALMDEATGTLTEASMSVNAMGPDHRNGYSADAPRTEQQEFAALSGLLESIDQRLRNLSDALPGIISDYTPKLTMRELARLV